LDAFFIEEKIHDLLAAKFQEETFKDCFLVELNLHKGNKLEVFIDCDSGMTLDKCQHISRFLESYLDQPDVFGEHYVLEVSSPGLSRPLKLLRQYQKNIGRKVEVTLKDGAVKTGKLKAVTERFVTIEETTETKEGKKKKLQAVEIELPLDNIKKTMIVICF
jgi:ribosome maturation factor RimP